MFRNIRKLRPKLLNAKKGVAIRFTWHNEPSFITLNNRWGSRVGNRTYTTKHYHPICNPPLGMAITLEQNLQFCNL